MPSPSPAPPPPVLGRNSYGKSRVRLVKVDRLADRHDLHDVTVDIRFEGDFETAHTEGDNSKVLPTDTMKNTVYAMARQHPLDPLERFGFVLAEHFLSWNPQVTRVRVRMAERSWIRLRASGRPDPHAFRSAGNERRLAEVTATREGVTVRAGVDELLVLKTTGSAFSGFVRDTYTTLAETDDRILATVVRALWRYDDANRQPAFNAAHERARQALLDTFAAHESASVQHTLWAMGRAALAACPEIAGIRLTLPNKHHLLVNLEPFGLTNPNMVYVATEEPFGVIEGEVGR